MSMHRSEAIEAAVKLARQYFLEKVPAEPKRTHFVARRQSYHGITLGALAVGGHKCRRAKFEPLLGEYTSFVSPCHPYRNRIAGEAAEQYVRRLADELDDEFVRVGPDTVCAFIVEPVVGAALGCVSAVPGYLEAVRGVCDKHGALLIFDEVMCGMGRTGTLHAWEQDGVAPDIQAVGKGLGAGFIPVAGVLANSNVVDILARGSGAFVHGYTFQGHPAACAAALRVQQVIQTDSLLLNVRNMGELLRRGLENGLGNHPNIGDIRGKGLFWGLEIVRDKAQKKPFPASAGVALGLSAMGMSPDFSISVYPGSGTVDGIDGDHVMICPPYNVTEDEIVAITETVTRLVTRYFENID